MAKKPAPTQDAKNPADCRIVVIHGKESFLRHERTHELRDALAARFGDIDVMTFNGETATPADVLDECRSFGLIAAHKLIIVEDAEKLVKEEFRKPFENYADAPSEGATLVLRSGVWRGGNLDKQIAKVGAIILCDLLDDREATAWVIKRAAAHHKVKIDREAASYLVGRVGSTLGKLDAEIGKLAAAAGEDQPITPDLITQFVGASREEEVWGIQSTLLTAGPEEALSHLRYVLDVSRAAPQLVIYAFIDLARKVHGASRALRQGASPQAIAKPLRLWGSSQDAILNTARAVPPERALRLLRECVLADTRSKSGLGDMEQALERLAIRFSHFLRPAAGAAAR